MDNQMEETKATEVTTEGENAENTLVIGEEKATDEVQSETSISYEELLSKHNETESQKAKLAAETERKEQVILKLQEKSRNYEKYIKSLETEKDTVIKVAQEANVQVPLEPNFTQAYITLYPEFEGGAPSDGLIEVVKEHFGNLDALSFRQNWSKYDPRSSEVSAMIEEYRRRTNVTGTPSTVTSGQETVKMSAPTKEADKKIVDKYKKAEESFEEITAVSTPSMNSSRGKGLDSLTENDIWNLSSDETARLATEARRRGIL